MRFCFRRLQLWSVLAGVLSLAAAPAYAQLFHRERCAPPPEFCPPAPTAESPAPPGTPSTPGAPPSAASPSVDLSGVAPEGSLALGTSTVAADSAVGYIDSAIPRTLFRIRADSAFDDTRPDRAEFFYAKCGCFRNPNAGPLFDPKAAGPGNAPEFRVDFVEVTSYLEVAWNNRISGFIEVPIRSIELNDNHQDFGGLGDINAGFKAALIADPCSYLTFQFRVFTPTGDADRGLGTDHVSLEPALLAYQKLTDRLRVEAELRDWIPIGGSDFAGNVLRYGIGASYDVYRTQCVRIAPVVELVGWTVLGGKELAPQGVIDASGDTIVNAKFGVRADLGQHNDLYVGYGRALTSDVWYKEIFRLEYRLKF